MKNAYKNSEYLCEISNYSEITDPKQKPFYQTNLKNTLETIVFKEISTKEKGILGKVFSDKSKTQKAAVKALLEEIELRENLDTHLLNN